MSNSAERIMPPLLPDPKPPKTPTDEANKLNLNNADTPTTTKSDYSEKSVHRNWPASIDQSDFPRIQPVYVDGNRTKLMVGKVLVDMPSIATYGFCEDLGVVWFLRCNTATRGRNVMGKERSTRCGPIDPETNKLTRLFPNSQLVSLNIPLLNSFGMRGFIYADSEAFVDGVLCQRVFFQPTTDHSGLDPRALTACFIPLVWLSEAQFDPRAADWPKQPKRFGNGWNLVDLADKWIGKRAFVVQGIPYVLTGVDLAEFAIYGDEINFDGERQVPNGHSSMYYFNDLDKRNNQLKRDLRELNTKLAEIFDEEKQEEENLWREKYNMSLELAQSNSKKADPHLTNVLLRAQQMVENDLADRLAEGEANEKEARDKKDHKTSQKTVVPAPPPPTPSPALQPKDSEQSKAEAKQQAEASSTFNTEKIQQPRVESPRLRKASSHSSESFHSEDSSSGRMAKKVWSTDPAEQAKYVSLAKEIAERYPGRKFDLKLLMDVIFKLQKEELSSTKKDDWITELRGLVDSCTSFFQTESRKHFEKATNFDDVMFEKVAVISELLINVQEQNVKLSSIHSKMEATVGSSFDVDRVTKAAKNLQFPKSNTYYPDKSRQEILDPRTIKLTVREKSHKSDESTTASKPPTPGPDSNFVSSTATSTGEPKKEEQKKPKQDSKIRTPTPVVEEKPFVEPSRRMAAIPEVRPTKEDTLAEDEHRMAMEDTKDPMGLFIEDPLYSYSLYEFADGKVRGEILKWQQLCERRKKKDTNTAIEKERDAMPKGSWEMIGWESHPYLRSAFPSFRLLQAGSSRKKAFLEWDEMQAIHWVTREDPHFDWKQQKLGVKETNTFVKKIIGALKSSKGTMTGFDISNLLPEGKKLKLKSIDHLEKGIIYSSFPTAAFASASPTPSRTASPKPPLLSTSRSSTPKASGTKRKSSDDVVVIEDEDEEIEQNTRLANLPPFRKTADVLKFDEYEKMFDAVKTQLDKGQAECSTRPSLKDKTMAGCLHYLGVALSLVVEHKLLEDTAVGHLNFFQIRCSIMTLCKELEPLVDKRDSGMVALRKYPWVLIPLIKWREWLKPKIVMTDDSFYSNIIHLLPVACQRCKNWSNRTEIRMLNNALYGKQAVNALGKLRKSFAIKHNLASKKVRMTSGEVVDKWPSYEDVLDRLARTDSGSTDGNKDGVSGGAPTKTASLTEESGKQELADLMEQGDEEDEFDMETAD